MQADAKRIILPRMVGFRKFGTLERVGCLLPLEGLWSGKGINVGSLTLLLPLIRRNLRLLNGLNQQAGDVIVRRVSSEEVEINHDAGRAMFSHWR